MGAFLAAFTLTVSGILAFYSLDRVVSGIEKIAEPNQTVELMNGVLADLSLLNNFHQQFIVSGSEEDLETFESFAEGLYTKFDTLSYYLDTLPTHSNQLDTLKALIEGIVADSKQLAEARQQADINTYSTRLLNELTSQIRKEDTAQDSSFVVKKTVSDIRISSYVNQKIDSLAQYNQESNNQGILKKIAGLFAKKQPAPVVDTLTIIPNTRIDTIKTVSTDSVVMYTNADLGSSLQGILRDVTREQKQNQAAINRLEMEVTNKHARVIQVARAILLTVNQDAWNKTFAEIERTYGISLNFKYLLLITISFFLVSGFITLVLLMSDVSKSQYYQEQLLEAKKKSDETARAKQDFLAKMSHEIRTPLTSIVGYSELLDKEANATYLKSIKKSSQLLLKTANEILDLAKIDGGVVDLNYEAFDLIEFLREIADEYRLKAGQKKLAMHVEMPAGVPEKWVYSDPHRLSQIYTNVLNNALKFTSTGEVRMKLTLIDERKKKCKARLEIQDTGEGIAPQDLKNIFSDFKQGSSSAFKRLGFGLGLSIVKRLVQLLRGTIRIESEQGKGTRVTLTLPFEEAQPVIQPKSMKYTFPPDLLKGKAIMVVDDDPFILKLFSTILEKYGAETHFEANAANATERAKEHFLHLCLIDIHLGHESGIDVCQAVKQSAKNKKIICVASTANLIEHTRAQLMEAGFDELLFKPVKENDLLKTLIDCLGISIQEKDVVPAQPMANGNGPLPVDLSEVEQFTMGDPALTMEILSDFMRESAADIDKLEQAVQDNDPPTAAGILHKLSSRLGQFKALDAAKEARQMESDIKKNQGFPKERLLAFVQSVRSILEQVNAHYFV